MSVFIARHGQTDDNARRILQVPSSPLSKQGHQQAQRLAARLSEHSISRIVCSDYRRTQQTAQYAQRACDVEPTFMPELRERNFGDIRGCAYADLDFDPFELDYRPPNGESWGEFQQRVSSAWKAISECYLSGKGNLLVVTHGLVCRVLIQEHLTVPENAKPINVSNTALTRAEYGPPWTVRLLNCDDHLLNGSSNGAIA